jgi:sestrin
MVDNHVHVNGEFGEDEDDFTECGRFSLLESLARRDEQDRALALDRLERALRSWREKAADVGGSREAQKLLREHLWSALALRWNSPFVDIRLRMGKLLEDARLNKVSVPQPLFDGPTSFIPRQEVVCYENENKARELGAAQSQYEESFVQEGRLSHISQVLGYHPTYLTAFIKMHHFLMRGNGPLPLHVRNYLAILAASRHKCAYLVSLQQKEFLCNGGDPAWIEGGIQRLPVKILNLLTINKLLAHQPWLVTPEHMKTLLRGTDSWSVSELAHAVVVMAHFHSLSSFALGCGLTPEIDTSHEFATSEGTDFPLKPSSTLTNPALGLGRGRENSDSETAQSDSEPVSPETTSPPADSRTGQYMVQYFLNSTSEEGRLGDTLTEKLRMMDSEESDEETEQQRDSQFMGAASIISTEDSVQKPKSPVPIPFLLARYIDDPSFQHEDFNGSSAGTLRARDYSWDDHGYAFLNSLYPDICPLLDTCFDTAFCMTYKCVGKEKNVDTTNFREAIWYYIHSIKGIRHDDYQYRKVNQVLSISFKTFIRMVACYPEKVSSVAFQGSMDGLEPSEKVHVNIIVVEARMQAELIYAMRALMTFMKS